MIVLSLGRVACLVGTVVLSLVPPARLAMQACAAEKTETFDRDPDWDGYNNRPTAPPVTVRQDFGFSAGTSRAGGSKPGEIGGIIAAAAEPAYYAMPIETKSFDDPLSASGTLTVGPGGAENTAKAAHLLIGFFNADTINEWRTPNTIAIRISARGDVFFAYVEYCTSKWRAGGDNPQPFPSRTNPQTGRLRQIGFASGPGTYKWSLTYDPKGNDGKGVVTATIGDATAICHLDDGHKADGATFNRFGILNVVKHAVEGSEFYMDDLTVNGVSEAFDDDPHWEGKGNRRTYETQDVRPRFDFGYRGDSNLAGGIARGEIGGLTFRGDCRYPERMACYGDEVGPLTLDKPIRASGKIVFTRGVTDSGALFGFYNSKSSMEVSQRQDLGIPKDFLGLSTDGPSSEGFLFSPICTLSDGAAALVARQGTPLHIYPDAKPREWSLEYDPSAADGRGAITLTLDGQSVRAELAEGKKSAGATFDRFGMVTTWIDGNGQQMYFDDLTYTVSQE